MEHLRSSFPTYGNDGTGNYNIYLQKLNNPCNATPITCGQTLNGSLSAVGKQDTFSFSENAGSNVQFILTRLSGNINPSLELYDSTGKRLSYVYTLGTSVTLTQTLPASGQYIVFVSDYGNDGTGTYSIKFQKNNNSCTEVIVTSPNGGEIIETGSQYAITWTPTSLSGISSQEIRLSTDGGQTFSTVIASGLAGSVQSFNWSIPTNIKTTQARIRVSVTDTSGISVTDDSDDDFIILQNVPKVTRTYEYDQLNRLVNIANEDGSTTTYTYDNVGNRTAMTFSSGCTVPDIPTLVSPPNNASNVSITPTLDWSDVTGATSYDVQVCSDSTCTTVVTSASPTTSQWTVTPALSLNTKYYWRARAKNTCGTGSWSVIWNFTTATSDITPPTGSIVINGGAEATKSTSVTLTLSATDDSGGTIQMCISNSTTCSSYSWTTFASTKSWTLSYGSGTKTVYAWFRDQWGNANATPYSDTIILDTTAPVNGTVTGTPGNTQVTLNWSGFSDAHSGIESYKVVYSTGYAPYSCSSGTTIYSGTDTTYIHTGLTNGITYYYRICAIDKAGNMSTGATTSAKPHL